MPHIPLPSGLPGIRGPMAFRPETAKPINELANILLFEPHSLSRGERELIATHVSCANECEFCQTIHGAYAAHFLGDEALVLQAKVDPEATNLSPKLKALLAIAGRVQQGGKQVTSDDVERARAAGASDTEIHDTVLIAAAFCMFNRYVDGLATVTPTDEAAYDKMGQRMAKDGYAGHARG